MSQCASLDQGSGEQGLLSSPELTAFRLVPVDLPMLS
jgi:hypothetical protein